MQVQLLIITEAKVKQDLAKAEVQAIKEEKLKGMVICKELPMAKVEVQVITEEQLKLMVICKELPILLTAQFQIILFMLD